MIGAFDYPAPAFADIIDPEPHAMSGAGFEETLDEPRRKVRFPLKSGH